MHRGRNDRDDETDQRSEAVPTRVRGLRPVPVGLVPIRIGSERDRRLIPGRSLISGTGVAHAVDLAFSGSQINPSRANLIYHLQ
jgi:hypothetical protein